MKPVIRWIVLALCLTGCTETMDKIDDKKQMDQPIINNVETIIEDDKALENKNNETHSFLGK